MARGRSYLGFGSLFNWLIQAASAAIGLRTDTHELLVNLEDEHELMHSVSGIHEIVPVAVMDMETAR